MTGSFFQICNVYNWQLFSNSNVYNWQLFETKQASRIFFACGEQDKKKVQTIYGTSSLL
jgi:hypothetical protein